MHTLMGEADKKELEKRIREGEKRERLEQKKRQKELLRQERISFRNDFKKFITKGNVLDLAVAVVIGTAFNAIVNGLVNQIIMPIVTYLVSGVSIEEWEYVLREEVVNAEGTVTVTKVAIEYGLWMQTILHFLIIALTVFVAVRVIRKTERKIRAKEIAKEEAVAAKKKVEEDKKSAVAKAEADAKAAKEQAMLDEFYANIREQSALLREIAESVKK